MKNSKMLAMLACSMFLTAIAASAVAGGGPELRVRCETRGDRSKISVNGKNLSPGEYKATVRSGTSTPVTATDVLVAPEDSIGFAFDSNPNDVPPLGDDTEIPADFIQENQVTAQISGPDLVGPVNVGCRVRKGIAKGRDVQLRKGRPNQISRVALPFFSKRSTL